MLDGAEVLPERIDGVELRPARGISGQPGPEPYGLDLRHIGGAQSRIPIRGFRGQCRLRIAVARASHVHYFNRRTDFGCTDGRPSCKRFLMCATAWATCFSTIETETSSRAAICGKVRPSKRFITKAARQVSFNSSNAMRTSSRSC